MNRIHTVPARIFGCGMLVILAASLLSANLTNGGRMQNGMVPEKHLFVCAGDESRNGPDFVAVVDFDPNSPNYGKVITTVPFPAQDSNGNEHNQVVMSTDVKELGCGGLGRLMKTK